MNAEFQGQWVRKGGPTLNTLDRLIEKVSIGHNLDECWEWTGAPTTTGYGRIRIGDRAWLAHRFAYEVLVGPIPEGLHIDHLCRNQMCVNPDHLEPVTQRENWRRGNHVAAVTQRTGLCQRGHTMEDAMTDPRNSGWRRCRTCHNENSRRWKLAHRDDTL